MLGIPIEEKKPEPDFEVFEENWVTVEFFLKCQTQWNTSMGGVTGLNYAGVLALANILEIDNFKNVFEDLQVLEVEAIQLLDKERK